MDGLLDMNVLSRRLRGEKSKAMMALFSKRLACPVDLPVGRVAGALGWMGAM